jgi:peptide subunit release factor 1 (eRF1)
VNQKIGAGGQSAKRYAQNRENEITAWFKKVNRFLMEQEGPIYVDISWVYYNRFHELLHPYNQKKIRFHTHTGYSGDCGVRQMISKVEEYERNLYK